MVTCSDDLALKIWETDVGRMVLGDDHAPWEGIIASGAADDALRFFLEEKDGLVDSPSYKLLLKREKAHNIDINSVQRGPGETRLLASTSDDGKIKIRELATLT